MRHTHTNIYMLIVFKSSYNGFIIFPLNNIQKTSFHVYKYIPTSFLVTILYHNLLSQFPIYSHFKQFIHFQNTFFSEVKNKSEVTQSCLTLCNRMECSPPGCSVNGVLQARILEWVAISFSRGSSQPRGRTQVPHIADSLPSEPPGKSMLYVYCTTIWFHILFLYGLLQGIEYSFLCYTTGPCCFSILGIIVCTC